MDEIDINEKGEVPGMGPAWACGRYGSQGHDYCSCTVCKALFERYLYQSGALTGSMLSPVMIH